jgi:hypothetical protein
MDIRGAIIAPKSAAGLRTVPIAKVLRAHLAAHRLRKGSAAYVFGAGDRPFAPRGVTSRAKGWAQEDQRPRLWGKRMASRSGTQSVRWWS